MSSATYNLFSTEDGSPAVGIWWLTAQNKESEAEMQAISGQFVRLAADLVEWVAAPPITVRGPYKLGVGPYKYTYEYQGKIVATNDSSKSQEFTILPIEGTENYYISVDTVGQSMWTAGEKYQPITVQPFTGLPNQVFKFVEL